MFSKSALVALSVALSGTAFAASASDQLALSLGVEPGAYTTAQLARLADARESNEKVMERAVIAEARGTTRGVPFAQPGSDTIIAAYANTVNDDAGTDWNLDAFIANVTGEYTVSQETIDFVRAHLDD